MNINPINLSNNRSITKKNKNNNQPSFKRYNMHILDGGAHGGYMEHFAKATMKRISADVAINFYNVETNVNVQSLKQLKNLEEVIRDLNLSNVIKKGDFVTLPGVAAVPLLNLNDRVRAILGKHISLTPKNIIDKKNVLLSMFKKIYDNKGKFLKEVEYMDSESQGMAYTFGVINEINKLVQKGAKVYVPSGHPEDNTIKWMARNKGLSPDLYKQISYPLLPPTPELKSIFDEIRTNNWYDFNVLTLSDASIVNVKNAEDMRFIFSAFDSCVNDEARGVYNFSPVRDNMGNLKGYGFYDEYHVDYPYEVFPHNDSTSKLTKFVGLDIRDCLAGERETKKYKKFVNKGRSTDNLPDKLYKITDIFEEKEIKAKKWDYLGSYINNKQDLVFDVNWSDKVIFNKLNSEGSDRPSVFSMWGSCFSTINAIKRDISAMEIFAQKDKKHKEDLSLMQKMGLYGGVALGTLAYFVYSNITKNKGNSK